MSVCLFVYLLCLFVETVSTTKLNGLIDIDHPNRNCSSSSVGESDSNSVGISISGTSSSSSMHHSKEEELPWLIEIENLPFILEELKIMMISNVEKLSNEEYHV